MNYTVRDLLNYWPEAERSRIVVLEDAMSSVGGFEAAGDEFITDMKESGLTVTTTANAFSC